MEDATAPNGPEAADHTTGPLTLVGTDALAAADGPAVLRATGYERPGDLRRLAAAWNATRRLPTEALELAAADPARTVLAVAGTDLPRSGDGCVTAARDLTIAQVLRLAADAGSSIARLIFAPRDGSPDTTEQFAVVVTLGDAVTRRVGLALDELEGRMTLEARRSEEALAEHFRENPPG